MSRTVNLDVNNYIIVGSVGANNSYGEKLGQIMEFEPDATQPGLYWLKIHIKVDLIEMQNMDTVATFSSADLTTASKLEVYSATEGDSILASFRRRIEHANARATPLIPDAPVPAAPTSPAAIEQVIPMTVSDVDTDPQELTEYIMDDREDVPNNNAQPQTITLPEAGQPGINHRAATTRQEELAEAIARLVPNRNISDLRAPIPGIPTTQGEVAQQAQVGAPSPAPAEPEPELRRDLASVEAPQPIITVDRKDFDLGLEAGDMKTVISIAAKSPESIFSIIDQAVEQNGHITFHYMDNDIKKKMISLKIDKLTTTVNMTFEKGKAYLFKYEEHTAEGIYLGDRVWIMPSDTNNIEMFDNDFIAVDADVMGLCLVTEIYGTQMIALVEKANLIKEGIAADIIEHMDTLPMTKVYNVLSSGESIDITSELLGEKWVGAITYYYFTGGELVWDKLKLNTFDTQESLKKLADSRHDTTVLEMIEGA